VVSALNSEKENGWNTFHTSTSRGSERKITA